MAKKRSKISKFFFEFKRRKVTRVIIAYATTAFVLLQVAGIMVDSLKLPHWVMPVLIVLLSVGFPLAIILTWAYHMKPEEDDVKEKVSEEVKLLPLKSETIEKSILVLPFDNMSSDPEQEYFSDGLTEEIITDLSYIQDLLVISRSSAMTFKGTKQTISEITDKVNVKYILEGSVRKSNNKIRITAQLIDARNDIHLWAKKYDGETGDIFEIQEKVSGAIASELKIKFKTHTSFISKTNDIRIFNAYYKALNIIYFFNEKDTIKAINELDQVLSEIGENALLFTTKAWAMWTLVNLGFKPFKYLDEANKILERALKLEPDFARTYAVLGWINIIDDYKKATQYFKKALSLDSNDQTALQGIVVVYSCIGKISESVVYMNKLQQIDPLNYLTLWLRGGISFYNGDFKNANAEWNNLYKNHLADASSSFFAALSMLYFEPSKKVLSFINEVKNDTSKQNYDKLLRMLGWVLENNMDKFNNELDKNMITSCEHDWTMAHNIAVLYSVADLKNEALNWLEKAIKKGFINYPMIAEKDTLLDNIRGEKKFSELVVKAKFEWKNFET